MLNPYRFQVIWHHHSPYLACLFSIPLLFTTIAQGGDDVLAGTHLLKVDQPLDHWMIDGLHRFCLRELANSPRLRSEAWQPHLSTSASFEKHVAARRNRLRSILGVIEPRITSNSSLGFELISTLEQSSIIASNQHVTAHRVRWPVIEGVTAEGLLLVPQTLSAGVVALPDAEWTPELFSGLTEGLPEQVQFVRSLAETGCLVAIPMLISRDDEHSGHAEVTFTNQPHREFIYRQAFEVGRHIIGYEVQKILAAVDLLEQKLSQLQVTDKDHPLPIGVVGVGEGGLLALSASALDPRIQSTWVSGYFHEREAIWQEPIYRNVWGLLTDFGDAELAGMIAPRRLVVEAAKAPTVDGPPVARPGRKSVAAPGRIGVGAFHSVQAEFERASKYFHLFGQRAELVLAVSGDGGDQSPGSLQALRAFAERLGLRDPFQVATPWICESQPLQEDGKVVRESHQREQRQFNELQAHVQQLLLTSHRVRDARWRLNPVDPEAWRQQQPQLRNAVYQDLIGHLPQARLPVQPRSRRVLNTPDYVGYEVVLDVLEDVIAAGILLLPTDLKAGEKRPVVVCQHGLEGTPFDTISREPNSFAIYKAFSEELVKQGFIVYAPQNPYRGGERFRVLQRMTCFMFFGQSSGLFWRVPGEPVDVEREAGT